MEVKRLINSQKNYHVRQIFPTEKELLKQAVNINNQRFGLKSTLSEFTKRAEKGYVLGYLNEQNTLLGSLCCVPVKYSKVLEYTTYKEATGNGIFKNADKTGDTLLCVAISVVASSAENSTEKNKKSFSYQYLLKIAPQYIQEYVKSGKDHVLAFHQKAKGGISGAKVLKILPQSRPEDFEAVGYNVLMAYPNITKDIKILLNDRASVAVSLIEHALFFAKKNNLRHVVAFSRPVGFRNFLTSTLGDA